MSAKLLVVATLLSLSVGAVAEEAAPAPDAPETPLQLQIVLSRQQGQETVASLPYTLSLNSGEKSFARVQAGLQVPLKFEGKDFPGNVVFKNVGTNLACWVGASGTEGYPVKCSIELGSVFTDHDEQAASAPVGVPPVLTHFSYEATLTLRDGQTAQYVSAADPLTGEIHKATITLRVLE